MNAPVISGTNGAGRKRRPPKTPKGRQVDPQALDEVRALLSDAPLLVLDDALSAVDTGTETDILSHLRELRAARPDRSVIVIAHRLSAVMDADEVIVLKQGHVVERGTHEQLLELGGWYAAQWRYQQIEASLDAA